MILKRIKKVFRQYTAQVVEAPESLKIWGRTVMDYLFLLLFSFLFLFTKTFWGSFNCPQAHFYRPQNYSKNNSSWFHFSLTVRT